MHYLVRKLKRRRVPQAIAIGVDGTIGPLARQAKLSPRAKILLRAACKFGMPIGSHPAASPLRSECAIELRHGDFGQGIGVIHDDDHVVLPTDYVIRTSENSYSGGRMTFQAQVR